MLQGDGQRAVPAEWNLPRQHLEKDDPQAVNVGPLVEIATACLLRRDVLGRPQHRAGLSQLDRSHHSGDAEVGQLRVAGGVEEDVLRLDVAMDHVLVVGEIEGIGELRRDFKRPVLGQGTPLIDELLERRSREVFHRDVAGAIDGSPVVCANDVGMAQPDRGLRFALKPRD